MRIAEISPYSLSVPGGVQGQVISLTHALRDLGHEVEILAPSDEPTTAEDLLNLGGSKNWHANGSIAPIAIGSTMWRSVRRHLSTGGFDVVHLHEPLVPFVGVASLVYGKGLIVGTYHRSGASPVYRLYGSVLRGLASRLDIRLAVSDEAARTARAVSGFDARVVGNGVELSRFKEANPWKKDAKVIMFIGRHEQRKGLGVLLEAVEGLMGEFEVWIAGDGPETLELHSRYRGNPSLRWLGRISDAEAASRLCAADIFSAPSLYGESFGVVLLEAMAAGAAVVASDISGYNSLIEDRATGRLVPPGSAKDLRGVLQELLSDDSTRVNLSAGGRMRANDFAIDRLAKTYTDLFLEGLSAI